MERRDNAYLQKKCSLQKKLTSLGNLAKRLAVSLDRAATTTNFTWSLGVLEITVEIEKLRNPSRCIFSDARRQESHVFGFDQMAAVEDLYAAHDALMVAGKWESLAHNHDEVDFDGDRLLASLNVNAEHAARFKAVADTLVALAAYDDANAPRELPEHHKDEPPNAPPAEITRRLTKRHESMFRTLWKHGRTTWSVFCVEGWPDKDGGVPESTARAEFNRMKSSLKVAGFHGLIDHYKGDLWVDKEKIEQK